MQFDTDISSPHKALFLSIRKLALSFDGVEETKKERITTYSYNGSGLCHIRTMPNGVDIGFLKGAIIDDRYALLHGDTKRMRVLSLENMKEKELKYYINEAIKLNRNKRMQSDRPKPASRSSVNR